MKKTALYDLHVSLGARMVAFAGYEMPVQFDGVMAEHHAARTGSGLFDVSHMGQVRLEGPDVDLSLERLVPQSVRDLAEGRQRYGFLTNADGGLIDDLMIARSGPTQLNLVVNAANKDIVVAHLRAGLPGQKIDVVEDRALLALQGPQAEAVALPVLGDVSAMRFMDFRQIGSAFGPLDITRSGYTGEDGFEISVLADQAEAMARALLAAGAQPCGLGARDSLRLEAGLCLHGQDIDAGTTPVEAGLVWAIQKTRRTSGAYPGSDIIREQLETGAARRRVGLLPEGRAPMRSGVVLYDSAGAEVGIVTSGGFGPTVGAPVAMGYVSAAYASVGQELFGDVRGKHLPVRTAALPFVPAGFKR